MRYIIVSSLPLLGPALGRIGLRYMGFDIVGAQTFQYAVIFAILAALILYDVKDKKDFSPYITGVWAFGAQAIVFYVLFLK